MTAEPYVSGRVKQLLGYEEHEIDGTLSAWDALVHPDDRERTLQLLSDHIERHLPYEAEYRMRAKSGEYRWLHAWGQAVWDESGTRPYHAGAVVDITERKRAENALAETEARYRQLVELCPDAIHIHQEGKLVFVNQACVRLFGATSPDQLLGRSLLDFIHPDQQDLVRERMRIQYEHMRTIPGVEQRALRLDGSIIDVDVKSAPFLYDSRPAIQTVVREIGERRRAEDAQRRSQKMQALGTLAGGIAHDFNNILFAIIGNTKLVSADLPPDHPAQQNLAEIAKAGARASQLVRRILSFSRQEESKRKPMRLATVVEEALTLLRATLPARVEIKTSFAPETPAVAGDAGQIHQVMLNLMTNAAHAIGDRDGLIEVALDAVSVAADAPNPAAELPPGRYARLTITDDGCGMDATTIERIFEPFFTTKPLEQGTGLGLSVVHGIMQNHDGVITVSSSPGKGTAFRLYFPAIDAVAATAVEPSTASSPGRGERLLYVDDDETLVLLATRSLSRLGYNVMGCGNSLEALGEFAQRPHAFDAVITDLSMPGLSGLDLARHMLATRSDIPIVLISGYVRPEDLKAAAAIGIREVLLKPNTVDDLAALLDRLLRERRDDG